MPDRRRENLPDFMYTAGTVRTYWAAQYDWRVGQTATGTAAICSALWLILEGGVKVSLQPDKGAEVLCSACPGDAVFLPPRTRRDIAAPDGARWLSIGLELPPPAPVSCQTLRLWRPSEPSAALMRQWITQASEEWFPPDAATNRIGWSLRGGEASRRISDGLGMALWGLCERTWQEDSGRASAADGPVPDWFGPLLEQIAHNPSLQLSELAQTAFVSASHLRRAFHSWTGMSPQEYRTRCRLNTARALLAETDRTVAYIAVSVGFDSPFHFSRLFKRRFGVSPAQYREIARSPSF